jgi:hypothetical protein
VTKKYGEICAVCEAKSEANRVISCAHILNSRVACTQLGIEWNERNFLYLCGTCGDEGSCHDAFDKGKMSFMHVSGDTTLWKVIGGGPDRHGRTVDLKSNPYKRTLHTHLARCVVINSLDIPNEANSSSIDPDEVSVSLEDDENATISNPSVHSVVSAEFITNVGQPRL